MLPKPCSDIGDLINHAGHIQIAASIFIITAITANAVVTHFGYNRWGRSVAGSPHDQLT
jgi:hypothetical protein